MLKFSKIKVNVLKKSLIFRKKKLISYNKVFFQKKFLFNHFFSNFNSIRLCLKKNYKIDKIFYYKNSLFSSFLNKLLFYIKFKILGKINYNLQNFVELLNFNSKNLLLKKYIYFYFSIFFNNNLVFLKKKIQNKYSFISRLLLNFNFNKKLFKQFNYLTFEKYFFIYNYWILLRNNSYESFYKFLYYKKKMTIKLKIWNKLYNQSDLFFLDSNFFSKGRIYVIHNLYKFKKIPLLIKNFINMYSRFLNYKKNTRFLKNVKNISVWIALKQFIPKKMINSMIIGFLNMEKWKRKTYLNLKIRLNINNIFITAVTEKGYTLLKKSAGMVGFKGSQRNTPLAGYTLIKKVIFFIQKFCKVYYIRIFTNASLLNPAIKAIFLALDVSKIFVIDIWDCFPITHNGIRLKKPRRV